jgi:O-methyltransferase
MYKEHLSRYPIISEQVDKAELEVLLCELEEVIDAGIEGDVVEFGCYSGTTSLFIQRLLQSKKSKKRLYVYDSFDGLPEKTKEDESPLGIDFKRGELRSTKAEFIHNFRKAGLPLPIIKKAWFHEIEQGEVPDKICFAFLDGDYYKSIRTSLSLIKQSMSKGSTLVVDDYDNPALPGAHLAVRDEIGAGYHILSKQSLGIISWS